LTSQTGRIVLPPISSGSIGAGYWPELVTTYPGGPSDVRGRCTFPHSNKNGSWQRLGH
jgi:hypothetical protein